MMEILKVYSNYLIFVLNDKDQGKQFLEEIKRRKELLGSKGLNKIKNDLINQPFATVKISMNDNSIG